MGILDDYKQSNFGPETNFRPETNFKPQMFSQQVASPMANVPQDPGIEQGVGPQVGQVSGQAQNGGIEQ